MAQFQKFLDVFPKCWLILELELAHLHPRPCHLSNLTWIGMLETSTHLLHIGWSPCGRIPRRRPSRSMLNNHPHPSEGSARSNLSSIRLRVRRFANPFFGQLGWMCGRIRGRRHTARHPDSNAKPTFSSLAIF